MLPDSVRKRTALLRQRVPDGARQV